MKNTAIATVVVGDEGRKIAEWSVPLMESYAKKTGSEFIKLTESNKTEAYKKPTYEKFQIGDLLNHFSRVLFLDADVLVSPSSVNIFELVPDSKLGAVSVEGVFPKVQHEKDSIFEVLGDIKWTQPYFNAGVMLLSQTHKCLYQETESLLEQWVSGMTKKKIKALDDQTLINYSLNLFGFELFDLGPSFNFTRARGKFHHRFKHHFIHYAGLHGNRDWQMMADYAIFNSPYKHFLFSNFPWLTWINDHFNTRYLYEKWIVGGSKR